MYQLLLTRKYLTSKVMPLLAALAVVLCTAMLLVVWSVMGGFLNSLLKSGRTLSGDVAIQWPNAGFAYSEDLLARLRKDPMVEAAASMIEAYGLVGFPDGSTDTVIIKGIDGPSFASVTDYAETLWWKPLDQPLPKDKDKRDPRLGSPNLMARLHAQGLSVSRGGEHPDPVDALPMRPGVVLGIEVSGFNYRSIEGYYEPRVPVRREASGERRPVDDFLFLPRNGTVTLNVVPLDSKGRVVEMASQSFPVANEFKSGLFEVDRRVVFVRLDALQKMLKMGEADLLDPRGPRFVAEKDPATGEERWVQKAQVIGKSPARVTTVLVRGKGEYWRPGATEPLRARVEEIYADFAADHPNKVPDALSMRIYTWEDQNAQMIAAVKKETGLVLFLFSFISMTAVFLVLAIFWSMISEKTRDIGTLRALGAGKGGVAGLWICYGAMLGVVGAALGVALAYAIVTNINPIHDWLIEMGRKFGQNWAIWDPRVYVFTVIPNQVETGKAVIVFLGGVVSAVLGSLWPAWRAARMDPVKALRFE